VKLTFARDLEVEFADRDVAIRQIYELGEKGARYPVVVYGAEGCGKTAWLKQATSTLREIGYDALYINPLHRDFVVKVDVSEIAQRLLSVISEASGVATLKLANMAILLARELMTRLKRRKIALLVDDVFQAIGLGRAELYV
jgi:GTPase SAR1 family protein